MSDVFVSYQSDDKRFVNLLVKLLEFHHINVWCDSSGIQIGTKFSQEIQDGLNNANSMVVVCSNNSLKSKWITKAFSHFQATKQGGLIVPAILEPVNLDEVSPGLRDYQAVDFTQCMYTGFNTLLRCFDSEFLPSVERRDKPNRRDSSEIERRSSQLIQRMRIGFWSSYNRETGVGKHNILDYFVSDKMNAMRALTKELKKYTFKNKVSGDSIDRNEVLKESIDQVWEIARGSSYSAIYAIEALAEHIHFNYSVLPITRRDNATDRRDTEP